MLYSRYVTASVALERGDLSCSWCERCYLPDYECSLTPAVVVLKQVKDPKLAHNLYLGLCECHYRPIFKLYRAHGWKVVWSQ